MNVNRRRTAGDASSKCVQRLVVRSGPGDSVPDQYVVSRYCAKVKALLTELGYDYAEVALPHAQRSRIVGAIGGAGTIPQVFVNGGWIGGV